MADDQSQASSSALNNPGRRDAATAGRRDEAPGEPWFVQQARQLKPRPSRVAKIFGYDAPARGVAEPTVAPIRPEPPARARPKTGSQPFRPLLSAAIGAVAGAVVTWLVLAPPIIDHRAAPSVASAPRAISPHAQTTSEPPVVETRALLRPSVPQATVSEQRVPTSLKPVATEPVARRHHPARGAPMPVAVTSFEPRQQTHAVAALRPDRGRSSSALAGPSFACAGPTSPSADIICGSRSLSALDRRLASVFQARAAIADGQSAYIVDAERTRFLNQRERCRSEACLERLYRRALDDRP